MFGFGGARWNNYFEGKPICKAEVKARVYNLKNIKATIRVVTREMINRGGEFVIEWLWTLCNMSFKSGAVSE